MSGRRAGMSWRAATAGCRLGKEGFYSVKEWSARLASRPTPRRISSFGPPRPTQARSPARCAARLRRQGDGVYGHHRHDQVDQCLATKKRTWPNSTTRPTPTRGGWWARRWPCRGTAAKGTRQCLRPDPRWTYDRGVRHGQTVANAQLFLHAGVARIYMRLRYTRRAGRGSARR